MTAYFAPGKLLLGGEYAVLDGAPALVLAVDVGVRCDVSRGQALEITTPDGDDRFVRAALLAVNAPPAHYAFSNVGLDGLVSKPGIGGSAAATVAAVLAGGGDPLVAHGVHRRVQGSGSGADVSASIHGGLIRFEAHADGPRVQSLPIVAPVVVFSGESARTGPRVVQYQSWDPARRQSFVRQMTTAVARFSANPIAATHEMGALLLDMADQVGLAYDTPALARLRALAQAHNGAARASGAGGGDCAVAFFADERDERAFRKAVGDAGFQVLPVKPASAAGVMAVESV